MRHDADAEKLAWTKRKRKKLRDWQESKAGSEKHEAVSGGRGRKTSKRGREILTTTCSFSRDFGTERRSL